MSERPFLIDCDTGTDDAIALLAALYSPQINVKAITSVCGNAQEMYTSQNNLNLVEYLGKSVPVAHGAVRPLADIPLSSEEELDIHGETGLGTIVLPTATRRFDSRVAGQLIYEIAVECKGELELLVTGPMTNVAIALCNHGDLAGLIKHIWFMGGAYQGGNVLPTAEANIWADALAAQIVIQSGVPMTMVGLDVTEKAIMTEEDIAQLRGMDTKACALAADLLDFMAERRDRGGEDLMMHDALALGAALCPECLTCTAAYIAVECAGIYTTGHTFVDLHGQLGRKPNASVALEIDVPMFRKWLVDTISNSRAEK